MAIEPIRKGDFIHPLDVGKKINEIIDVVNKMQNDYVRRFPSWGRALQIESQIRELEDVEGAGPSNEVTAQLRDELEQLKIPGEYMQ